jgi:hypothetical protein
MALEGFSDLNNETITPTPNPTQSITPTPES